MARTGLRKQAPDSGDNGINPSEPATAFPTAVTTAAGFNPENLRRMGEAIGQECCFYGVDVLLGPGVNLKRNPLCGRNFEYFSEDPYLAGECGAAEIEGVQSQHVGVALKHFAMNNSENFRFNGNSVADERSIRELYLKPFERAVKKAHPMTMMCAYNKINGTYCCENRHLLTDILRDEWGFEGLVMSDWGATHDRVSGVSAGLDLEMPGDTVTYRWIMDAVQSGRLSEEDLDTAVRRVLQLVDRTEKNRACRASFSREQMQNLFLEHHDLACDIACDCAVLLKNDGALPLSKEALFAPEPEDSPVGGGLLVVGELFEKMRYQGAGSSMIQPAILTTFRDAFDARGISYSYARGYHENQLSKTPGDAYAAAIRQSGVIGGAAACAAEKKIPEGEEQEIRKAVKKAEQADTVLVFAGLTDYSESEGCDRDTMRLPDNQLALIDRLIQTKKKIIVVLCGGSAMEVPFAEQVSAILYLGLAGEAAGEACLRLLLGEANPSGRLSETWPICYSDIPYAQNFGTKPTEVYRESVFIGYRYFETLGRPVRYPFGYGLSYTSFSYSDLTVLPTASEAPAAAGSPDTEGETKGALRVSVNVTNTGDRFGGEVVQCYVSCPTGDFHRPVRELKAFSKVYLKPGESARVEMLVDTEDLKVFDPTDRTFRLISGEYVFSIGKNAHQMLLDSTLFLKGSLPGKGAGGHTFCEMSGVEVPEDLPTLPITVESRFSDMRSTFMGRILYRAVLSVAKKMAKKAKKETEGIRRDNMIKGAVFLYRILNSNSLITMSMSGGKSLQYPLAEMMAEMANGHILKGLGKLREK